MTRKLITVTKRVIYEETYIVDVPDDADMQEIAEEPTEYYDECHPTLIEEYVIETLETDYAVVFDLDENDKIIPESKQEFDYNP